jgi:hypothetical protein
MGESYEAADIYKLKNPFSGGTPRVRVSKRIVRRDPAET